MPPKSKKKQGKIPDPDARLSARDRLRLEPFWNQIAFHQPGIAFAAVIGVETSQLAEGFIQRIQSETTEVVEIAQQDGSEIKDLLQEMHSNSPMVVVDLFEVEEDQYAFVASNLILYRDYIMQKDLRVVIIMSNGLFAVMQDQAYDFLSIAAFAGWFEDLQALVEELLAPAKEVPKDQVELDGFLQEIENLEKQNVESDLFLFLLNQATRKAIDLGRLKLAEDLALKHKRLSLKSSNHQSHIDATIHLGATYHRLGKYRKGIKTLKEIEKTAVVILKPLLKLRLWENLGQLYLKQGKFKLANNYFKNGLSYARELNEKYIEGIFLADLSTVFASFHKIQKAVDLAEQAIHLFSQMSESNQVIRVQANLANISFDRGEYRKAFKYWIQASKEYKTRGDLLNQTNRFGSLGNLFSKYGDWDLAQKIYERGLELFNAIGSIEVKIPLIINLGDHHLQKENYSIAYEYFSQALAYLKQEEVPNLEARVNYSLGQYEFEQKNYPSATQYLIKAQSLYKSNKDIQGLLDCQSIQGSLYRVNSNPEKALQFHSNALLGAKKNKWKPLVIEITTEIGLDYTALGNPEEALLHHQKAAKQAHEINYLPAECLNLGYAGLNYIELGDTEKASRSLQSALRIARVLEYPKALKLFTGPLEKLTKNA